MDKVGKATGGIETGIKNIVRIICKKNKSISYRCFSYLSFKKDEVGFIAADHADVLS